MVDLKDLEALKKDIKGEDDAVRIDTVNILFLDISSSCTGYSIANVDFVTKKAKFKSAGCLWLDPDWCHQEKYSYMFNAILTYFWVVESIDYIVVEQYSVNPKKMMGINVVSEMQGAIKTAAWENGVKVASILPQSWRSLLGIKPIKNKDGTKDYKTPTKDKVLEYTKVPDELISNITKNNRQTPSDVYDAIAIGLAWLKKFGLTNIDCSSMKYNTHIGANVK